MSSLDNHPPEQQDGQRGLTDQIRLLYVEDDHHFAEMAGIYLEREDDCFSVDTVPDASRALERLDADIDCLVSDYNMPGMNGIELLEAVRETHPDLPFILYTGKGSEEVASEAISAGVTDYLQKETGAEQFTVLANRVMNAVEQHRTKETLDRQTDRLDTIASNLPVVVFALDTEGTFTYSQGRGLAKLGLESGEVVGDSIFEVYGEYDTIIAAAERALEGEEVTHTVEISGLVFETTFEPVFDHHGAVETVVGAAIDITDRIETERELVTERRRFQNLFENLSQPTVELEYEDGEPIVRRVNLAFEDTFGYEAADIRGESLDAYIVPEDQQDEATEINETVQETGKLESREVTRKTVSGTRAFLLQDAVFNDGSKAFAVYSDITERKERQRDLEILEEAIENAHTPLVLSDPSQEDNPLVYVNKAFEAVTGYSRSEAVGRNCRFLQGEETDPEKVARLREATGAEEPVTVELRNYRKDGTPFWNRVSITPIYDSDGNLIRYFGSQEDITEKTESQRRLKRQNERLDNFTSVVSHDLRNPLHLADGHLELAREECDSPHLETVDDALDRCQTLIDDLLAVARTGVQTEQTEPVELRGILPECWETVETADATLAIETAQTIKADRTRFTQLLENLLRNAVEHGGADVHIRVEQLDEASGFAVADDGPGIPADERDQVFESGYSTADDGTGFGLAIIQEVVQNHNWSIRITESAEGGARFEITGVEIV